MVHIEGYSAARFWRMLEAPHELITISSLNVGITEENYQFAIWRNLCADRTELPHGDRPDGGPDALATAWISARSSARCRTSSRNRIYIFRAPTVQACEDAVFETGFEGPHYKLGFDHIRPSCSEQPGNSMPISAGRLRRTFRLRRVWVAMN